MYARATSNNLGDSCDILLVGRRKEEGRRRALGPVIRILPTGDNFSFKRVAIRGVTALMSAPVSTK